MARTKQTLIKEKTTKCICTRPSRKSAPATGGVRRPRYRGILFEIKNKQKFDESFDENILISKKELIEMLNDINEINDGKFILSDNAIKILIISLSYYIIELFENLKMASQHAGRPEINIKDFIFLKKLNIIKKK